MSDDLTQQYFAEMRRLAQEIAGAPDSPGDFETFGYRCHFCGGTYSLPGDLYTAPRHIHDGYTYFLARVPLYSVYPYQPGGVSASPFSGVVVNTEYHSGISSNLPVKAGIDVSRYNDDTAILIKEWERLGRHQSLEMIEKFENRRSQRERWLGKVFEKVRNIMRRDGQE